MTHEQYVEILKRTAYMAGVKLVMERLVSRFAFFRLALINPLAERAVSWVVKSVIENGELGAFFWYIDLRVSAQGRDFEKAAMIHHKAQQGGTDEEKRRAEQQLIDSFRVFAKFNQ